MEKKREQRAAEIQDLIRQVLLRDWNPIGVNNDPELADEYDSYIAPVYRILVGSAIRLAQHASRLSSFAQ